MEKLFWVDLEMTGLDVERCHILEVAVIITDVLLKPLDEYHQIVYQPPEVLEAMEEWSAEHHKASGLTDAIPSGMPVSEVEKELLALAARHYPSDESIVLCGNSVGMDKRFIEKEMPDLAERLHYRIIDVSSFKQIFLARYGVEWHKGDAHRALDDIRESIAELAHYLQFVNVPSAQ